MDRRAFVATMGAGIVTAPITARGQSSGKVHRIGYLTIVRKGSGERLLSIFFQALRDLGWVEGRNLLVEWRFADGKADLLRRYAAEMVTLNVDLIVAPQSDSALAAKRATATIPIVHVLAGDAVADGLVASVAHPEANVTGLTATPGPEMSGKGLEILKEVTRASRVAVLRNPSRQYAYVGLALDQVKTAARILGVQLQFVEASAAEQFESAFREMTRLRAEALFALSDSMFWAHRVRLADLEAKHRLPSMHDWREYVEAGSLMSYGPDLSDLFRRAATYVDRILRGARPADLPVEQPTKFEMVINLKTARALGLTIPQSLLLRADQVIQ